MRTEDAAATRVEPHPYIGIVKNNLDPTRAGRLQVFIPDLGGDEDEPRNWRTVSYASPFMGTTPVRSTDSKAPDQDNRFTSVAHTYGMWMVPPDLDVEVIVLFIGGDPMRGYWIGCVNPNLSKFMLPGIAGSTNVDPSGASESTKKSYKAGTRVPVAEFNNENKDLFTRSDFYNNPKPIHEYQYDRLKTEGLDRDPIRGSISSSSQRESPSHVFGISTPGRPFNDPADNPSQFKNDIETGALTEKDYRYKTRKGGHTFIMDDGSVFGEDQLLRLRSATGHQILFHDTQNTVYIAHADGTSWIEMSDNGQINVYSDSSISLRTKASLNLKADQDVNIHAGSNINMFAQHIKQEATGKVSVLAGSDATFGVGGTFGVKATGNFDVNSATASFKATQDFIADASKVHLINKPGNTVIAPTPITKRSLSDTSKIGDLWISNQNAMSTIVTVAPTHEPFRRGEEPQAAVAQTTGVKPSATTSFGPMPDVSGTNFKGKGDISDLRRQPPVNCKIGNLSADQATAFFAAIGKSESGGWVNKAGGQYAAVNSIGFIGKYQFGSLALQDLKYVRFGIGGSNWKLDNPSNWLGKDGIWSKEDFLANGPAQEKIMCEYVKLNYSRALQYKTITADTPPEDVAGILAISHLLGSGGAIDFRKGKNGADANGTTASTYFQKGKYAVVVLAPQMAQLDAPIKSA